MHEIEFDGHTWTRTAERRCAYCSARTYRIHRRAGQQLLIEPLPGPLGTHTFMRETGPRRLVALCARCFRDVFGNQADRVLSWARDQP